MTDRESEIVKPDAATHQTHVDAAELARSRPVLRRSLKEADSGIGIPASTVLAEIREKLGIRSR